MSVRPVASPPQTGPAGNQRPQPPEPPPSENLKVTPPPPPVEQVTLSQDTAEDESESVSPLLETLPQTYGEPQPTSYLAEEKDPNATVAVFDNFAPSPDGGPGHGELTEGVVAEVGGYGEDDIQRYEIPPANASQDFEQAVADGDEDALKNLVEDIAVDPIDSTTAAMQEILNDPDSKITTISQSQSISASQIAERLLRTAMPEAPKEGEEQRPPDPDLRSALAQSVGLTDDVSDEELTQAVVDEINSIYQNSDTIAESKERYDQVSQQAAEAGISHVLSSGNRGGFSDYLEERGVEAPEGFYQSSLVNEHTTVVGATDDRGTPDPTDDNSFEGNAPDAGAEVSAPGTHREMTTLDGRTSVRSGTSYSAPEVAAVMANLKAEHPELTPQQIEELLVKTAVPVNAPANEVGAGAVDREAALAAAG